MAVNFTTRGGEGGYHSQGDGCQDGSSETGTPVAGVGPGTQVAPDFSPVAKGTGCSGGT